VANGIRTTDLNVSSYRRLVVRSIIPALASVFNAYTEERQLAGLQITNQYPKKEQDYPCVVVEFHGGSVQRAGVGHVEIFQDETGVVRKWLHNLFRGSLNLHCYALSSLDQDILADAVMDILTMGTIYGDPNDLFWKAIYGDPNSTTVLFLLSQLMLNLDEISDSGVSVAVPSWRAEDQLIYSSVLSLECNGAYYNTVPDITYDYITGVTPSTYPEGDVTITLPLANSHGPITNPRQFYDDNEQQDPTKPADPFQPNTLKGVAVISGAESKS